MVIEKVNHISFSDFPLMTKNIGQWLGFMGKIEPWTMKTLLDDYTLAFFNKHIKQLDEPILNKKIEKYPEIIKFEVRQGKS